MPNCQHKKSIEDLNQNQKFYIYFAFVRDVFVRHGFQSLTLCKYSNYINGRKNMHK